MTHDITMLDFAKLTEEEVDAIAFTKKINLHRLWPILCDLVKVLLDAVLL